jgi:hypothetical protein
MYSAHAQPDGHVCRCRLWSAHLVDAGCMHLDVGERMKQAIAAQIRREPHPTTSLVMLVKETAEGVTPFPLLRFYYSVQRQDALSTLPGLVLTGRLLAGRQATGRICCHCEYGP